MKNLLQTFQGFGQKQKENTGTIWTKERKKQHSETMKKFCKIGRREKKENNLNKRNYNRFNIFRGLGWPKSKEKKPELRTYMHCNTQYFTTIQGGIERVISTAMLSFALDLSLNKLP